MFTISVYFPELDSELDLKNKNETQYIAQHGTEHILVVDDEKHILK